VLRRRKLHKRSDSNSNISKLPKAQTVDAAMRQAHEQVQAAVVRGSPFLSSAQRKLIVERAAEHRLGQAEANRVQSCIDLVSADPAPPGRDRAQARPHAGRTADPRRHRLFGAPRQSSKEGLKKGISPGVRRAGWAWLKRSKSLAQMNPGRGAKRPRSIRLYAMQSGKGRILLRAVLPTCPGRQWLGLFRPNMARTQIIASSMGFFWPPPCIFWTTAEV
jgi:hypothetical protein